MNRNPGSLFHPLWNRLERFQKEMNRLMGDVESAAESTGSPPLNLWEEGEHLVIEAELPGLSLDDLELYISGGNQLTLKGQRKAPTVEKGVWHRQERPVGSFSRSFTLPFPVDADKVDARLVNGVLTLRLTKHASALPRKIVVKSQ